MTSRSMGVTSLLVLFCGAALSPTVTFSRGQEYSHASPRTKVLETGPMKIDRIYRSMTGPYELVDVDMSNIDWVTGIRTEVIEEQGESMGGEFFCYS